MKILFLIFLCLIVNSQTYICKDRVFELKHFEFIDGSKSDILFYHKDSFDDTLTILASKVVSGSLMCVCLDYQGKKLIIAFDTLKNEIRVAERSLYEDKENIKKYPIISTVRKGKKF